MTNPPCRKNHNHFCPVATSLGQKQGTVPCSRRHLKTRQVEASPNSVHGPHTAFDGARPASTEFSSESPAQYVTEIDVRVTLSMVVFHADALKNRYVAAPVAVRV